MTKKIRAAIDTSSAEFRARAARRRATWTITRYRSLDEMKAAEYAYWAQQPAHVVMSATAELSALAYGLTGIDDARARMNRRWLVRMRFDADGAEVPAELGGRSTTSTASSRRRGRP
jgi:hypothetical protein